jgi:hypothetical protein
MVVVEDGSVIGVRVNNKLSRREARELPVSIDHDLA